MQVCTIFVEKNVLTPIFTLADKYAVVILDGGIFIMQTGCQKEAIQVSFNLL